MVFALNRIFRNSIDEGSLNFLQDRILHLQISDWPLEYRITLDGDQLVPGDANRQPDVRFGGNAKEFLLLGLGKEDPDTLFFQRRLQLEGDTELGLEIKNFLYTLGDDFLPKPARALAERLLTLLK